MFDRIDVDESEDGFSGHALTDSGLEFVDGMNLRLGSNPKTVRNKDRNWKPCAVCKEKKVKVSILYFWS